ncbi:uncharacterized protein LOC124653393 [Lolium rigidum]|uniref:uncharacterized protein LOC124653393 n=1 Tax=Lolium rigidum TaxID=89674 RepID=UPI001F5E2D7D|nr:uncharacterized protein LOC124653393 [Lolium rigidum]
MARKAGKKKGGSKPKPKTKTKTPPSSTLPTSIPPPQPQEPKAAPEAIDVLNGSVLRNVLRRLPLVDLLRAALACHRWRRVAACCLPRAPPLLGYFFHPVKPPPHPPTKATERAHHDAVFAPLGASSPLRCLNFAPDASRYKLYDCHQGLLLLEPTVPPPKGTLPRLLVADPATRRHALLPPPPRRAVPDDRRWRPSRHYVGSALLSRAHPSRLRFEAVCFAVEDDGRPRAWVASVDDGGQCRWRALPRDAAVQVDFDPKLIKGRCVHAAGSLYWHICNSGRVLALDPATLRFSYLLAPAVLGDRFGKYRVGETPDDGRLCIATVENQVMQLWVRGETSSSDNGWRLEKEMDLHKVYDTVPGLPRDARARMASIWITDIDAGRTGKIFIQMSGYGRYSFDLKTRKLERLLMKGGMEYGDPIYPYLLAWPPAFLAQA